MRPPTKLSKPKNDATKKRKRQKTVHIDSLYVKQQVKDAQTNNKKTEFPILLSSDPDNTVDKGDGQDKDSTGSSPIVKHKNVIRTPASERKTRKSTLLETMWGSSSAPPKPKLKGTQDQKGFFGKNIFCKPDEEDDNDFYLNYHPAATIGYEGLYGGFDIPAWMPMTFRPTEGMNMNDICAYTATYIFKPDPKGLLGHEVLIKTTNDLIGDRKTLKSLMPRCPLDQEIINLVVARQIWMMDTIGRTNSTWYLPTEFAQYALETHRKADEVREIYKDKFMTPEKYVSKMFIPMNDQGKHWYLMVVDFGQRKLVWLDSLHCAAREDFRRRAILKMAIFLEEILMHESYDQLTYDRMISNYSMYKPRHIQQQRPGSNDCGVWVAKWLTECAFRSEYSNITVNTTTRMKLAIHLVKSANNVVFDDVLTKAATNWRMEEEAHKYLVRY